MRNLGVALRFFDSGGGPSAAGHVQCPVRDRSCHRMLASYCVNPEKNSGIMVVHENSDFVRDLINRLRLNGFSPRVFKMPASSLFETSAGPTITCVIDIDMKERHLRLLRRVLRSRAAEPIFFFVNATGYKKGDWPKIDVYCGMLALRDRLSKASDTSPES